MVMEVQKRSICRPDSPLDGPADGMILKTDCIRADILENPNESKVIIQQREKSEASIAASVGLGTFSIRDRASGVMLTVAIEDVAAILNEAMSETDKEKAKCQ